jgi:UMF1 family MFS transporter
MVPALVALWWAMPAGGLPLMATSGLLIVLGLVYNWGDVLSNSLLGRAAGEVPGRAALISGLGYAVANGLSVALLIFMLWGMVLPGQVDWPGVPHAPLFGLDASKNEPSRISGPLSAAVLLLGAIPFFLWTPDAARTGRSWMASLRAGLAMLRDIFGDLRGHRDIAVFLGGRLLYNDGMTALLVFGGLLAAGLMKWGALEMLAYGISLSVFGVVGGLIAPWFDRTLGPRKAVQLEIAGSLAVLVATLGMSREKILYFWAYDPAAQAPVWNGPLFRTAPELIYLGLGLLIAVFVTAQYASSRTLLIRLCPPDKTAAFFGLYALSGTATMWLGSLLVALATAVFKSQVGGFLPVAALLLMGFCVLFLVKGGGAGGLTRARIRSVRTRGAVSPADASRRPHQRPLARPGLGRGPVAGRALRLRDDLRRTGGAVVVPAARAGRHADGDPRRSPRPVRRPGRAGRAAPGRGPRRPAVPGRRRGPGRL